VILYEKAQRPGGQLRLASVPPFKQEISKAVSWLTRMCEANGVEMRLGREATTEDILSCAPEAVIVATGARPCRPEIKGIDGKSVIFFNDILEGRRFPGDKVLIVGEGRIGCELADLLGEYGRAVTIVERLGDIAIDIPFQIREFLLLRLKAYGVRIETRAEVREILEDGVVFERDGEIGVLKGFDSVVLALGSMSEHGLKEEIEGKVPEVFVIGDAVSPRSAREAMEEAARLASRL
jgi:pyruvate/2-oxoglutarate dehydrogenase complex dihydrolipoamide dehydrogenase (E3) component